MSTDIAVATRADLPDLLPLVEEYWRFEDLAGFDRAAVGAALARLLDSRALGDAWVARAGGRAVGYLIAVYVFSLEHHGLTAEIDEFFVLPSARGKGLGKRLLQAAEAEFERRGCTNASLQLGRGNDAARRFYLACGYGERAGFELLDKMLGPARE